LKKNRVVSRYILLITVLFWGYYLAKPNFPFTADWYLTIITTVIYGFIAVELHRFVQDFFAVRAGDVSQKFQKKPFKYYFRSLDIIGFLCFPIFGLGWSNSTVSPKALTGNDTLQRVWIILSGCLLNLLLAVTAQMLIFPFESISLFVAGQLSLFAKINMYYFVLSLLPIPQLDGWLIYKAIRKQRVKIERENFYGEILLVISMITYIMPWFIDKVSQSIMYWL
jgi:Zn-dependent protease